MQRLDLGCCSSLWQLPNSLLQLPDLHTLILPSRAIGQYVVEQLDLRSHPEVLVLVDPPDIDFSDIDWGLVRLHDDDDDDEDDDDDDDN
jgi:hypothetical protein